MPNEITISNRLQITKDNLQFLFAPDTKSADLTSVASAGGNQLITGTEEALDLNADVLPNGIGYWKNLSTSIPVEIGVGGFTSTTAAATAMISLFRLNAGEASIARAATTNILAKAIVNGTNTSAFISFQIFSP
jgi:hypothetical protein